MKTLFVRTSAFCSLWAAYAHLPGESKLHAGRDPLEREGQVIQIMTISSQERRPDPPTIVRTGPGSVMRVTGGDGEVGPPVPSRGRRCGRLQQAEGQQPFVLDSSSRAGLVSNYWQGFCSVWSAIPSPRVSFFIVPGRQDRICSYARLISRATEGIIVFDSGVQENSQAVQWSLAGVSA